MSAPLASVLGASAFGWLGLAAGEVVNKGPDLGGIAAIIAAVAGLVGAVGSIVIGLRSKQGSEEDLEKELLMKLLKEQLEKDP